jgi:hypothetical protein
MRPFVLLLGTCLLISLIIRSFHGLYRAAHAPRDLDTLLDTLLQFLRAHLREHHGGHVKDSNILGFRDMLRDECKLCASMPQSEQVEEAAQVLWSSTTKLMLPDERELELCSLINEAIRKDGGDAVFEAALPLVHAISLRLHIGNRYTFERSLRSTKGVGDFYPRGEEGSFCYRGSAMPEVEALFYEQMKGNSYRVPGFFTTSLLFSKTVFFVNRSLKNVRPGEKRVPVFFRVHLDERGRDHPDFRCTHAARLLKTVVPGEIEFMFVPYSVFKVTSCTFFPCPTYTSHELFANLNKNPKKPTFPMGVWLIDLEAALDSNAEPITLPLAGYY